MRADVFFSMEKFDHRTRKSNCQIIQFTMKCGYSNIYTFHLTLMNLVSLNNCENFTHSDESVMTVASCGNFTMNLNCKSIHRVIEIDSSLHGNIVEDEIENFHCDLNSVVRLVKNPDPKRCTSNIISVSELIY